ncbi:MgtC/SapB family protein [Candidatus Dojkabacteria bacterium]|uniref:MgtC/SapB family protein n=1 Tax=Candidatus Dojkabacteria bacterium TaxID=2099670 RepID=A0A955IC49_9BACT|nr:MgtC/SapB family protein [Candidatus Dojkabacteria bacterium]
MNRKIGSIFLGITLIIIGGIFTLENYIPSFSVNWEIAWPIFLVIPGLFLWSIWIMSAKPSQEYKILIPANILMFIGIISFINAFLVHYTEDESVWGLTTFMYPGAFAITFWIAWAASEMKDAGLKTVALIASIITLVTLVVITPLEYFDIQISDTVDDLLIPTILLVSGVIVMFSPIFEKKSKTKLQKVEEKIESTTEKVERIIENIFEKND